MKYVDEFRDSSLCKRLVAEIHSTVTQPWTLMEVCGGQTHSLLRYGIDQEFKDEIELIHGPGCPVCVTPVQAIDQAIELTRRDDVLITTFGDMLRVPGTKSSLMQAKSASGNVRIVYSPTDAVRIAEQNPARQIVFLAVGFETTTPATALAAQQARALNLSNFSLIVSHVRVMPAMEMLAAAENCRVQGFLAAGHVCSVTGYSEYEEFARRFNMPVVVTGFEPVDLLAGILECVRQLESGVAIACNQYQRSVSRDGNSAAQKLIDDVYELRDQHWRGLGTIPSGGWKLRDDWSQFDATEKFLSESVNTQESNECRSGEVLTGHIKPPDCEFFGTQCSPDRPMGAPMVSAEGACAAYYRYTTLPRKGESKHNG